MPPDLISSADPNLRQQFQDALWPEFVCDDDDVPAYGIVEVTSDGWELKSDGAGVRIKVQQPSTRYEDRYPKYVNGRAPVSQGQPGRCTRSGLIIAKMVKPTSGGDLAYGDWFVATEDAWTLQRTFEPPAGIAFHYCGGYKQREDANTGLGIFEYRAVPHQLIYVELSEDLAAADDDDELSAPQEAEAKVLKYDFDTKELSDSGETLTISSRWNVAINSGTRLGTIRARDEYPPVVMGCP